MNYELLKSVQPSIISQMLRDSCQLKLRRAAERNKSKPLSTSRFNFIWSTKGKEIRVSSQYKVLAPGQVIHLTLFQRQLIYFIRRLPRAYAAPLFTGTFYIKTELEKRSLLIGI